MNGSAEDTLLQRVLNLERRQTRTRALGAFGVLCALVVLILGLTSSQARQPQTIRANRFVLVDNAGRERAFLGFRERAAGLYIFGQTPKDETPLVAIHVESFQAPEVNTLESGGISLRSEVFPTVATLSPTGINFHNEEDDRSIRLGYFIKPALEFIDRSGFPFIELSHNDKRGTLFRIHAPLGMKDAWSKHIDEIAAARIEGKDHPVDPALERAYEGSRRVEIAVRPFARPYMRLWKDSQIIWGAVP